MAAVAVVAVTVGWVWHSAQATDVPPWRVSEEQAAERCLDNYAELSLPVKAKPVERILLRKEGGWLRVHVSEPDNWIHACEGGPAGMQRGFGCLMEQGPPDKLRFFGGYDSVLKARLLLGHLPTGATSIEARLVSGQTIRGDHDGDIFVIWAPGVSVEGAQVTATGSDGVIIATTTAPSETG
ncbi:hypothetical protein [Micromonospora sp. U21]|uniref:hypothetical protein n=1 Tax=Micromonospora sp. U21 TaxID=2824899 RepID=UPI001B36AC90|nr:hypothetical protein [Micromonospora sp. U21]